MDLRAALDALTDVLPLAADEIVIRRLFYRAELRAFLESSSAIVHGCGAEG
jgi:hypothetical protein